MYRRNAATSTADTLVPSRFAFTSGTRVNDNGTSYHINCPCDTAPHSPIEYEPLPQPGPRQPEPPRPRWRPVVSLLRRSA